jgi:hypothetical protein
MDPVTEEMDVGAPERASRSSEFGRGVRAAADLAEWLAVQREISDAKCTPAEALQNFAETVRETFLDRTQDDDGARL